MITAKPDITHTKITPDCEWIMVACDGIWEVHPTQTIVDYINKDLYKNNFDKTENQKVFIDPHFCDCLYDFLSDYIMAEDPDE